MLGETTKTGWTSAEASSGCSCRWIAEVNGENAGCVMLVKDKEPGTARIRLLLVDPKGRGLGLGTRLTDECVKFAREAGYRKVTLWTHSVLTAAALLREGRLHADIERTAPHLGQGCRRGILGSHIVSPRERRLTPDLLDHYKREGVRLRREAQREACRRLLR